MVRPLVRTLSPIAVAVCASVCLGASSGCLLFAVDDTPDGDAGVTAEPSVDGGDEPDGDAGVEPEGDAGVEPEGDAGVEPEDGGIVIGVDAGPPPVTLGEASILDAAFPVIRGDSVAIEIPYSGTLSPTAARVDPGSGWAIISGPALEGGRIRMTASLIDDRVALPGTFSGAVFFVVTIDFGDEESETSLVDGVLVRRGEGPHVDTESDIPTQMTCGHPALPCPSVSRAIANMNTVLEGTTPDYEREIRVLAGSTVTETDTLVFGDLGLGGDFMRDPQDERGNWVEASSADQTSIDVTNAKVTFGTGGAERAIRNIALTGTWESLIDRAFVEVEGDLTLASSTVALNIDVFDVGSNLSVVRVGDFGHLDSGAGSLITGPTLVANFSADATVATVTSTGEVLIAGNISGPSELSSTADTGRCVGLHVTGGMAALTGNANVNGGQGPTVIGVLVEGNGVFQTPRQSTTVPSISGGTTSEGTGGAFGVMALEGATLVELGGSITGGTSPHLAAALFIENLADTEETPILVTATLRSIPNAVKVVPETGVAVLIRRRLNAAGNQSTGSNAFTFANSTLVGVGSDVATGLRVLDERTGADKTLVTFTSTTVQALTPESQTPPATNITALHATGSAVSVNTTGSGTRFEARGVEGSTVIGVDTTSPMTLGAQIIVEEFAGVASNGTLTGVRCASPGNVTAVQLLDAPSASPELNMIGQTSDVIAIEVGSGCNLSILGDSDDQRALLEPRSDQGSVTGIRQRGGSVTTRFARIDVSNVGGGAEDSFKGVDFRCPSGPLMMRNTAITAAGNNISGTKTLSGVQIAPPVGGPSCTEAFITLDDVDVKFDDLSGGVVRGLQVSDVPSIQLHVVDSLYEMGIAGGAIAMDVEFGINEVLIERNAVTVARAIGSGSFENAGIRITGSVVPDKVQIRNNFVDMSSVGGGSTRRSAGIVFDDRLDGDFEDLNAEVLIAHNTILVDGWGQSVGLAVTAEFSDGAAANHLSGRALANLIRYTGGAIGVQEVCNGSGNARKAARFSGFSSADNFLFGPSGAEIRSFTTSGGTTSCSMTTDFDDTLLSNTQTSDAATPTFNVDGCPEVILAQTIQDQVIGALVWAQGDSSAFGNWSLDYDDIKGVGRNLPSDIGSCEVP